MNKDQFSQKITETAMKYKKIHKIIFGYGVFFMIAIISGIIVYNISNTKQTISSEIDSLEIQKEQKRQDFLKKIDQINLQTAFQGKIALGHLKETDKNLESFNNLLYYKGYIIPRFFQTSKNAPLQSIEYFSKTGYSLEELDTIYKNIFIGNNQNQKEETRNVSFPITKGIIEEFNLECLFQKKINGKICNIFIQRFIDNFFIQNIDNDIETFTEINKKIFQQNEFTENLCKGLLNYTLYTQIENKQIKNLIEYCPQNYKDQYNFFIDFIEVEKELNNKFISNNIYKNDEINIYKLISFQQIISDDISRKILNIDSIKGYFSFLQEALKNNKIGLFYKELTYFFNNYHIKKAIENTEITNNINNKSDLDEIAKLIITINNGNPLIGFQGLKEQVNNNILIQEFNITQESNNNENYEQKIENLLKQIRTMEIKQKFLSGDDILLYGNWQIENIENNYNKEITSIPTKLRLVENKNTLKVKQIMLEGFDEISDTINKLSISNNRSFVDLQKYIYQNSFLFGIDNSIKETEIIEICQDIKQTITNQEIKICNSNKVDIDILRNKKITTMTVYHENFILNNIDISDPDAKLQLNEYLNDPDIKSQITYNKINKENFIDFIQKTIDGFLDFSPEIIENFEGSSNTIIIIEKIKKYLGIQINDIAEKNEKILIDFTINNINFIGQYIIKEHKISPLYFKEANINKTPVLIKNISLTLSDDQKPFLNAFLLNPLDVIKQYSPEEYLLYQKFISEKQ